MTAVVLSMLYNNYIYRTFFSRFIIIMLVLLLMVWLGQTIRFMNMISANKAELGIFIKMVILLIPSLSYLLLPIAAFIAMLICYNHLQSHNEMMIFQIYNYSKAAVIKPFIISLLIISIIGLLVSNFILPYSYKHFRSIQLNIQDTYLANMIEEKTFFTAINGITIYVEKKKSANTFQEIFVCDNRSTNHKTTIFAKEAALRPIANGGMMLFLNQGVQYEKSANGSRSSLKFDQYIFNLSSSQGRKLYESDNKINSIFAIIKNAYKGDKLFFYKNITSAAQRLIWPLNSLIAGIIVLSILLNAKFSRKKSNIPTIAGFAIAASYLLLSNVFVSLANRGLFFFIIYLFFTIIFTMCFLINLYRPNYWSGAFGKIKLV